MALARLWRRNRQRSLLKRIPHISKRNPPLLQHIRPGKNPPSKFKKPSQTLQALPQRKQQVKNPDTNQQMFNETIFIKALHYSLHRCHHLSVQIRLKSLTYQHNGSQRPPNGSPSPRNVCTLQPDQDLSNFFKQTKSISSFHCEKNLWSCLISGLYVYASCATSDFVLTSPNAEDINGI